MIPSTSYVYQNIHLPLANVESIPILGPIFASPAQIIASAVEMIAGILIALISSLLLLFTCCSKKAKEYFAEKTIIGLRHSLAGFLGILWGAGNIASLGCLAYHAMRI